MERVSESRDHFIEQRQLEAAPRKLSVSQRSKQRHFFCAVQRHRLVRFAWKATKQQIRHREERAQVAAWWLRFICRIDKVVVVANIIWSEPDAKKFGDLDHHFPAILRLVIWTRVENSNPLRQPVLVHVHQHNVPVPCIVDVEREFFFVVVQALIDVLFHLHQQGWVLEKHRRVLEPPLVVHIKTGNLVVSEVVDHVITDVFGAVVLVQPVELVQINSGFGDKFFRPLQGCQLRRVVVVVVVDVRVVAAAVVCIGRRIGDCCRCCFFGRARPRRGCENGLVCRGSRQ